MGGAGSDGPLNPALYPALFERLALGLRSWVSVIDRERSILYLNRTLSRPLTEVLGRKMEEFIALEQRDLAIGTMEAAFRSGSEQQFSFNAKLADGRLIYLTNRVLPFSGPNGEELALLVTEDDTDKHYLSPEPARSAELRRIVVDNLPDFVVLLDRNQRFVWINRLAPGLHAEDVIGALVDGYVEPESLAVTKEAIARALEQGVGGIYEAKAYKDGTSTAWYQTRTVPIVTDGEVTNVLLVTSDITERKRAEQALRETEEQLHQAQRQESIGQLAGGIAHDFNNLLQVLRGTLYFAQQGLKRGDSVTEELEQATRATERAAELTSHLLAIGRRKRIERKPVDLGGLVEHSVRMLRRAIPENVTLTYRAPEERCFVELDAPQFEQVLINLCVNARDAMPQGGGLTITVEAEGGTHVILRVEDTGSGIPEENLGRVFEPFFTTKGAGSGLGLAVAAGIVAAHAGEIVAESRAGRGTTMRVRLPRVEVSSDRGLRAPEASSGGRGVILVAEDDDAVRVQAVRVLEDAGYRVIAAENGARAIEEFKSHADQIQLALLDVIMPEGDGWHVYQQIEKLRPGTKVLFSTGYAASVLPEDFAAHGVRLLSKPYHPATLLERVREALAPVAERP